MSTLSLRLPDSLHEKVRELAERDDTSINQFIATAVAEKTSALLTLDYLAERGRRGRRAAFEQVLSQVADRPPLPGDEFRASGKAPSRQAARPSSARRAAKQARRKARKRG
jgi:predicted transcriptional regulator